MKRTAIYMRVSTTRQAEEGDSIPAQRDALRKYIDDHDDMIFAGEYLDDGISGTKLDRDELQRLLEDVQAGKIDLILVVKLDRWFRSIRHYVNTQELLDRYGVGWLAIWEPIYDSTTPQGRLIINQMMSIAQFEAENTGQRIRQVFAYKSASGEVLSGKIPIGYSIVNKRLVPNDDAPKIRAVFEHYSQTGKLFETGRILAGYGFPRTAKAVKALLKNKRYVGESYGNPGFCEPIIAKDLFDDVQRKLNMNVKKSQVNTYIFTGLMVCHECGHSMTGHMHSGTKRKRYRCTIHYSSIHSRCQNSASISEAKLEKYLVDNVRRMVDGLCAEGCFTDGAPAIDTAKQIAAIDRKIEKLKDLYLNDLISMDEYKVDKERLMADRNAIKAMQPDPPKDYSKAMELIGSDLDVRYWEMDAESRRRFWRSVIKKITFGKDRKITVEFL